MNLGYRLSPVKPKNHLKLNPAIDELRRPQTCLRHRSEPLLNTAALTLNQTFPAGSTQVLSRVIKALINRSLGVL